MASSPTAPPRNPPGRWAGTHVDAWLAELGLPVFDPTQPPDAGGVKIVAAPDGSGLLIGWRALATLADDDTRFVQRREVVETMTLALGGLLTILEIGRAHVLTPVTPIRRMPAYAWKKKAVE